MKLRTSTFAGWLLWTSASWLPHPSGPAAGTVPDTRPAVRGESRRGASGPDGWFPEPVLTHGGEVAEEGWAGDPGERASRLAAAPGVLRGVRAPAQYRKSNGARLAGDSDAGLTFP